MIDYGLLALFAVILVLVFLAFHAWRGIKADGDRILAVRADVVKDLDAMRVDVKEAMAAARAGLSLAMEVQGTHYKSLLKRIDEAEATTLGHQKQVELLAEKMASFGGRLSALARWQKKDPEPAEPPAPDGEDPGEQVPRQGNTHVPGNFGRIPARKVG